MKKSLKCISVEQAQGLLIASTKTLPPTRSSLKTALGTVLASDIQAPLDLPPFRQSGVDGFAIRYKEHQSEKRFHIIGESKAGDKLSLDLAPGEAIRVFTGAQVPEQADAVVLQEFTRVSKSSLILSDDVVISAAHCREKGSHVRQGQTVLHRGQVCSPSVLSLLASLGINSLQTFGKPKIALITTGTELVAPGRPHKSHQIYDANTPALEAALQHFGYALGSHARVKDELELLEEVLASALETNDVVLMSGGISMGDYDHVELALRRLGVRKLFHGVFQRPGKPLYFGRFNNTSVLALPGNPASVLCCFYEYVLPLLRHLQSHEQCFLPRLYKPLLADVQKPANLCCFMRAEQSDRGVQVLEGQESYRMLSFVQSNCLAVLPAGQALVPAGTIVEIHQTQMSFSS